MKTNYICIVTLTILTLGVTGCTSPNPYGTSYSATDARTVQEVYYGTIVKTQAVTLEASGQSNLIGSIAGAAIGGILGSKVGGGSGSDIAAIGGGLLGGYAGSEAASEMGKTNGVNLTIKFDDTGKIISIVQAVDPNVIFEVGQQVQVNMEGSTARVVPR